MLEFGWMYQDLGSKMIMRGNEYEHFETACLSISVV